MRFCINERFGRAILINPHGVPALIKVQSLAFKGTESLWLTGRRCDGITMAAPDHGTAPKEIGLPASGSLFCFTFLLLVIGLF